MTEKNDEMSAVQLYKRLLKYVKPYWPAFVAVIIAMIVYAATETGVAMVMKPLMDGGFVERDRSVIVLIPFAIIGLFIVRGFADFFTTYGLGWIARNVIKTLREEMFNKLLMLPASYYDHSTSGQLMSKLLYDVEQVAGAATDAVLTMIRDSLTILGLLIWMFYLNGFLSLFILITVPFVAFLVYVVSIRFRRLSKNIQNSMGSVSHVSSEIIDGHREVKTFGSQQYEAKRFDKVNQQNRSQQMKKIATDAISQPLIALITACGLALVIYIATMPQLLEEISVGGFISFVTAMMMLLTPLKRLTKVNAKLQAGIAAADSIFSLLDEETEVDNGTRHMERAKGDIQYDR
ncbi:ABC transporter transmembrane domain-containing protein, partial [Methylophaga sp. OBS3]|uniref:ABC transporter permease n=1 Tax=Methylophaga sp. OBS3 TaxID=2991934 RepID=UPI00225959E2